MALKKELKGVWTALVGAERDPRAAALREQLAQEADLDFSEEIARAHAVVAKAEDAGEPDVDADFQLAGVLIRTGREDLVADGLRRAERIARHHLSRATYPTDELLAHCYYYIGLAKYHLGSLDECVAICGKTLKICPEHQQTLALRILALEELQKKDAKTAALGTGLLLGALGAGLMLAKKK